MSVPQRKPPDNGSDTWAVTQVLLKDVQAYLVCRARRQAADLHLKEAWDHFFQIYDPIIRRFAITSHVPANDLSDCQQDVWKELIGRLPGFDYAPQRGKFTTWLYTLVRSKANDLIRCRARHPLANLDAAVAATLSDHDSDPAGEYERECHQEMVQSVLAELKQTVSPRNYQVLHLRWCEGRTVLETATALQLKVEQVRLIEHRMKVKFRRLWEDRNCAD